MLSGEWWLDSGGQATFADGDVGDANHEMIAWESGLQVDEEKLRELYNKYGVEIGANGINFEDVGKAALQEYGLQGTFKSLPRPRKSIDLHDDDPAFKEFIKNHSELEPPYNPDDDFETWLGEIGYQYLIDAGASKNFLDWYIKSKQGDARDYALEHMGWIRVKSDNFQMWNFDDSTLKAIRSSDVWENADDPESVEVSDETIAIEQMSPPGFWEIPARVLFDKDYTSAKIKQYGERAAPGAEGEGFSAYNPAPPSDYGDVFWTYANNPGIEDYLRKLGASEDVVEFILEQPEAIRSKLGNEVRKSPGITVEDLAAIAGAAPKKREPMPVEVLVARNIAQIPEAAREWLVLQLVKARRVLYSQEGMAVIYNYAFPWSDEERVDINSPWMHRYLSQLFDWYRAEHPQLASYSLAEAWAASDAWHQQCALTGKGGNYQNRNVVFEYPDGWTVQAVTTENDLEVEGNRMGHCVGSYWDRVESGKTRIYSLRDPQNYPHATIEVYPDQFNKEVGYIQQIQGKGNKKPIDEYKLRLKEWFSGLEDIGWPPPDENSVTDTVSYANREDVSQILEDVVKFLDGSGGPEIGQRDEEYGAVQFGGSRFTDSPEDLSRNLDDLFAALYDKNTPDRGEWYTDKSSDEMMRLLVMIALKLDDLYNEKPWVKKRTPTYEPPKGTHIQTLENLVMEKEEALHDRIFEVAADHMNYFGWFKEHPEPREGSKKHALWEQGREAAEQEVSDELYREAKRTLPDGFVAEFFEVMKSLRPEGVEAPRAVVAGNPDPLIPTSWYGSYPGCE